MSRPRVASSLAARPTLVRACGVAGAGFVVAVAAGFLLESIEARPVVFYAFVALLTAAGVMQVAAPGAGLPRPAMSGTSTRRRPGEPADGGSLRTTGYLIAKLEELAAVAHRHEHGFAVAVLALDDLPAEPTPESAPRLDLAAQRLGKAVRAGDTAAPIGPNSFAVALALAESDPAELYAAGARLVNAVSRASHDGPALRVSLGVAMYEGDADAASLLDRAVHALQTGEGTGHVGYRRRFRRTPGGITPR